MANRKIGCFSLVLTLFVGCVVMEPERGPAAYFAFQGVEPNDVFIIELTDPLKVQHARNILDGTETRKTHISGRIVKSRAPYNSGWSYHLDPDSITFFDLASESCDAKMRYIEQNLNRVGDTLLPDKQWCPWASKLIREIPTGQ